MPVTATGATGSYSAFSFSLSLSNSLFLSLLFLFPSEIEIFISGDREPPIARALPLFSRQPRYLRDGCRASMFLSGTVQSCSFLSCPSHISFLYFSILLLLFLILPTAMSICGQL